MSSMYDIAKTFEDPPDWAFRRLKVMEALVRDKFCAVFLWQVQEEARTAGKTPGHRRKRVDIADPDNPLPFF